MNLDIKKTFGVVGFAFAQDRESVLLIRKQRPPSQAGKLNGVGGKLEPGEQPIDAMVREFSEEAGVDTVPTDWTHFAVMKSPKWEVWFYRADFDASVLDDAASREPLTHERVERWDVHLLPGQDTMRNLRWLIPFCLDTSPYVLPLEFSESM